MSKCENNVTNILLVIQLQETVNDQKEKGDSQNSSVKRTSNDEFDHSDNVSTVILITWLLKLIQFNIG